MRVYVRACVVICGSVWICADMLDVSISVDVNGCVGIRVGVWRCCYVKICGNVWICGMWYLWGHVRCVDMSGCVPVRADMCGYVQICVGM